MAQTYGVVARKFFNAAKKLGALYLNDDFKKNAFIHPLYLMMYGKNKEKVINRIKKERENGIITYNKLSRNKGNLKRSLKQIVVNSIFITPCALPAVIIVARSLSRKRRNHSACDYEPHRSLSVLYRRG